MPDDLHPPNLVDRLRAELGFVLATAIPMDPGVIHNNRLVLLTADDGRKLVLKRYYRDDRRRLEREFGAFAYLRARGFDAVPVPHLRDHDAYAAVYSCEPGRTKLPHELTFDDLTAIGRLAGQLHSFVADANSAEFAPSFVERSWAGRCGWLRGRTNTCLTAADAPDAYPELRAILVELDLAARLPRLIDGLYAGLSRTEIDATIPDAFMRFNPGDFAPHNLLIDGDRVCAIDFEYFGPEEAAGLPASFLAAEQSADLTPAQADAFLAAYHAHRDVPDAAFDRYPRLRALFEVSWVLVNLSLMTPAHVARKQFAGDFDLPDHLAERAAKLRRRLAAAEPMVAADMAALDQLLHDNLTYTHSAGNVDTKASLVESIKTRRQYAKIEPSSQEFRVVGDTAVATGQARIELNGGRILNLRFTDVWVKRGDSWKMVAWQSTPLAAG